ncbi:MAG: MotA/TolQ/ExbB proton channel family protein [Candidatus Moduliflexus flocculans]|nr:MotA/TolQ/ExbB proton channel family protein [Candidatus Moduliflexus flocculans]
MSMISFGVVDRALLHVPAGPEAVEAVRAAGGQVPQGRPPEGSRGAVAEEGIPLQPPRQGRPGRPERALQFQADAGGVDLSREDMVDTVRRAIQRASALTASDLKRGVASLATIGATAPFVGLLGTVVGIINGVPGHRGHRVGRHRRRVGRHRRSARRDRARPRRGHPGGVVLQLPDRPDRVLQRRDGQLLVGARRLLHQEDRLGWRGCAPGREARGARRPADRDR